MPYKISTFTLPGGASAVRADVSGDIDKEDVAYFLDHCGPGRPLGEHPLLITTRNLKSLTTEARGLLVTSVDPDSGLAWCAMVLHNPVVRVMISFMTRIKKHPKLKLFGEEEDALRWLDERAREDAATPGTPLRRSDRHQG